MKPTSFLKAFAWSEPNGCHQHLSPWSKSSRFLNSNLTQENIGNRIRSGRWAGSRKCLVIAHHSLFCSISQSLLNTITIFFISVGSCMSLPSRDRGQAAG